MRNGETRKRRILQDKTGAYSGPPMPSSFLTVSSTGPTFWTAFLIFSGGNSRVRDQKSSASGFVSLSVGSGGS